MSDSPTRPTEYAEDILDELGVDDDAVRDRAHDLVDAHASDLPHTSASIAAACVYFACACYPGQKRDQSEVAAAAGIAEATVSSAHSSLCDVEFPGDDGSRKWLHDARRWINTLSQGGR